MSSNTSAITDHLENSSHVITNYDQSLAIVLEEKEDDDAPLANLNDSNVEKDNYSEDDTIKNHLLEDIIPIKNIKDFAAVNKELQCIYTYINKSYCDLNSKLATEQARIENMFNEKISDIEKRFVSDIVTLNGRVLLIEDELKEMKKA